MADKVLAWGVLCGSGERAGKLHEWYDGDISVCESDGFPTEWAEHFVSLDAGTVRKGSDPLSCGPHRVVPLGVVERGE